MTKSAFTTYRSAIEKELKAGNATEHTHRPALKALVEALQFGITATNEPKRVACGAPDYVISISTKHGPLTVGYIEAKDVGVSLDDAQRSEQLGRYCRALDNLILTDYLQFRWYVGGEERLTAVLGASQRDGSVKAVKDGLAAVEDLLKAFLAHRPEPITSPRVLAARMAHLTHLIRDIIVSAFERGEASGMLSGLREAFDEVLLPDLSVEQFADTFAETITYGLFAARANHKNKKRFRRQDAASEIPKTNPFLRRLFGTIAGPDLDEEPFAGFVDDVAQLLADSDMETILADFGRRTRQEDLVIHFYETFLQAYDPAIRELRGVYYTPEPVVSYIIRSVDFLLKARFGCKDGLADTSQVHYEYPDDSGQTVSQTSPRVLVLDPACGTGTFLYAVVDVIREFFVNSGNAGMWSGYVGKYLLPRLFGFELLMAPYAVAHLKLGMQLAAQDMEPKLREAWAYDFGGDDRLGVFLTNSLEEGVKKSELLLGRYISEEANAAAEIKRDLPIMVVLGNPPYSGHSANKGKWITGLIEDYKRIDGKKVRLGQAKWLQNDYVKFIRLAEHRISQTGYGVVGYITDHSYVDSGTFVAMRACLQQDFNEIYVLDLQGNAKRNRNRPDVDENVFDITQGVAILIAVKYPGGPTPAVVHVAQRRGLREEKYDFLTNNHVSTTEWETGSCGPPYYLFVIASASHLDEYDHLPSLTDLMPGTYQKAKAKRIGTGFVTTHDSYAIAFNESEMNSKVKTLLRTATEAEAREIFRLCSQSQWNYEAAKTALKTTDITAEMRRITYRPFDWRYTVWNQHVCVHRRIEVHRHLKDGNIALCIGQAGNVVGSDVWALAYVTREPVDINVFYRGGSAVLPLYLYPEVDAEGDLFANGLTRHANMDATILEEVAVALRMTYVPEGCGDLNETFGPEDAVRYVYAIMHSPAYRERYAEFLNIDFPRIPFTSDKKLFRSLVGIGDKLISLHLMDSFEGSEVPKFPVAGDNYVAPRYPTYVAPGQKPKGQKKPVSDGRIYINESQYFDGISQNVWDFQIGGYQVCEKWLKDRRERKLGYDDLKHCQRTVSALSMTLHLMEQIDEVIEEHGGWPLA